MTFVLSVVAAPPEHPGAGAGGRVGSGGNQDGNRGIEELLAMMQEAQQRGLPYEARIERAAYVRDLAILLSQLRDEGDPPDIIQIVGHGSPGRLQLGSYWTGVELDPDEGHAVLSGNPESYGMLIGRIPAAARVFLLGCHVGAEGPSGYVASGKALLFSLEILSGAHVYASDGLVIPDDFADGFLYDGSLVMSCGKPANPGAVAKRRAASKRVRRADAPIRRS